MIDILSVDWDFFFPDTSMFDWGHNETHGWGLINMMWHIRAYETPHMIFDNTNPYYGKYAIDFMHPDECTLRGFWSRNVPSTPGRLIIAESHASLPYWIVQNKPISTLGVRVWNFDAHHDVHYIEPENPVKANGVRCDNWVLYLQEKKILKEYHLVYPEWRMTRPETSFNNVTFHIDTTNHYPDTQLPDFFPVVFICRSPHWTPPWDDNLWIDFIEHWRGEDLWADMAFAETVLEKREFDRKEAYKQKKLFQIEEERR